MHKEEKEDVFESVENLKRHTQRLSTQLLKEKKKELSNKKTTQEKMSMQQKKRRTRITTRKRIEQGDNPTLSLKITPSIQKIEP